MPVAAALQLGQIRISGVEDEVLDNVRANLSIADQPVDRPLTEARFEYLLQQIPEQTRRALEPFGYYDVDVVVTPQRVGNVAGVAVQVLPGQPVRIREHNVEIVGAGADDPIIARLHADFEPRTGEVLRHELYEASKRNIQRGLLQRGFFGAEVTRARVEVTRAEHSADIFLAWQTGERARYGELRIEGSHIDPELLRSRAREQVQTGEAFDQTELLLMHQRLVELDYFSVVEVQPLPGEASGDPPLVPIEVNVEPAKRSIYKAGISFGTDFGLGVQLGFDRRWVNPRGHKFASELEVSQRRSIVAGQYRIPAFERVPGWWGIGARAEQLRTGAIDSDRAGILISRNTEWRGDRWTAEWHIERERYDDRDLMEQRYTTLVYPSLRFERTRLDEPLYPRGGYSISAQTRAGSTAIGSDVDFAQLWVRGRLVFGIGEWQRLIFGAEAGRTFGDQLEQLPPSLRFFAGGDRSVRGYAFQELGPRNSRGEVIGGRNLLAASVEFERMFTERWGGAVFVDAGNAFNSTDFEPAVGVGVGVRWRSPIGPVRVDLAHGLDEPESVVRLHLTIGPLL
jgi:translocation and assembly module TamA